MSPASSVEFKSVFRVGVGHGDEGVVAIRSLRPDVKEKTSWNDGDGMKIRLGSQGLESSAARDLEPDSGGMRQQTVRCGGLNISRSPDNSFQSVH